MHPSVRQVLSEHNGLVILGTFPGESWGEEVVYVNRQGAPAFVLVLEPWGKELLEDSLTHLAARLPVLAERWGCPAAGLVSARVWYQERSSLPGLLEQARHQGLLFMFLTRDRVQFSDPERHLSWRVPSRQSPTISLPPFPLPGLPFRQDFRSLIQELETGAPSGRHKVTRAIARLAWERLKYTQAFLLTVGREHVLAETASLLASLQQLLEAQGGRRYMLWSLIYLAASPCCDPWLSQHSWPHVKAFLDAMAARWDSWTSKEQRVIVRGLKLLVDKGAESRVPPEHPLWPELRRWSDRFLEKPTLGGWRWSLRVREFVHSLAGARALPPATVGVLLQQHEDRERFLREMLWGMAEDFWATPSAERWEELDPVFSRVSIARDWFKQFVRVRLEVGTQAEFWDFIHTLRQQGSPEYLRWIQVLIDALHGVEKRHRSQEVQSELRTGLQRIVQSEDLPSWAVERIRQIVVAMGGENL